MNTAMQIGLIVLVTVVAMGLVIWFAPPTRADQTRPLSNQDRLLRYIERRAAWEGEQRKQRAISQARMDAALDRRAAQQPAQVRMLRRRQKLRSVA